MESPLAVTLFRPLTLSASVEVAVAPGHLPPVSPRTADWLRKSLAILCRFLGRDSAVEEVGYHDIERWHISLLRRMSPVTANNYLRAVRIVYNRLIKLGYVSENPATVPYAPQPPNRPQAISEKTYRAMKRTAGVRDKAIIALLWATGCRIGELPTIDLRGLQLWTEKGIRGLAAPVVGKYHRRLSLQHATRYLYASGSEADSVAAWLDARPDTLTTALFPSKPGNSPIPVPTLHSILRKLRTAAGLTPETIANAHAFRHAFAYRKRKEGYPLEWISEWLGHADPAFTARMYGDKSEPEIRRRFFSPPPGG